VTDTLAGKRIGVLTASASRLGGGVFEAIVAQAAIIRRLGGEAIVFALDDAQAVADRDRFAASEVRLVPVNGPRQIGFAPALVPALLGANLDALHLHGIWMYPSRAGLTWARRTGRPYYISPHGMLDPWILARGRWKKALARAGYERAGWCIARRFHALTLREAEDITGATGRGDCAVIPNPAPALSAPAAAPAAAQFVYLGRIHPKKNLAALVEAWAKARLPENARLTLAGWGETQDVAALKTAIVGVPAVEFIGPVFGDAKAALLEAARFTILPSLSEGLPLSLLESWACGVPTIQTADCNLGEGLAAGAALECGHSAASIVPVLEAAAALGAQQWQAMSAAASGLAGGQFSLDQVALRWGEVYGEGFRTART
jgi:poly(glycerol-phosphate) alpha-glucosyltransferase